MSADWRREVTDPDEVAVFAALASPRWDFRTVDGLVSSTHLAPDKVQRTIARYPSYIRRSPVPGPRGQDLYTLQRDLSPREALSVARSAFSKSAPTPESHGSD